jgi:hypothetical protein
MAIDRNGPRPGPRTGVTAVRKPRPDPGPLRIALGLAGMATASALVTAFLTPAADANAGVGATVTDVSVPAPTSDSVRHVTRYVQLQPGQTAPPAAIVQQAPAPKPRIVVVRTKQSGGG